MNDSEILARAYEILEERAAYNSGKSLFTDVSQVKLFLKLRYGNEIIEKFTVMYLDAKLRLIDCEYITTGTVSQCCVYPREIARRSLELNASNVIIAHNHPSGDPTPSDADRKITNIIVNALKLIEVKVIDHIIVGLIESYSFSGYGLL